MTMTHNPDPAWQIPVVRQNANPLNAFRLRGVSVRLIVDELAAAGFRTKLRPLRNGNSIGGVPFMPMPLSSIVRRRCSLSSVTVMRVSASSPRSDGSAIPS